MCVCFFFLIFYYCTSNTCMLIIACPASMFRVLEFVHWTAKMHTKIHARTYNHDLSFARLEENWSSWWHDSRSDLCRALLLPPLPCRVTMTLSYFAVGCYFCLQLYIISTVAVRPSVGYCAAEHQQFYMRHELRYVSCEYTLRKLIAPRSVCIYYISLLVFGCGGFSDTLVHRTNPQQRM